MAWPAKAEKAARLIRRGLVLAMVPGAVLSLAGCSSVPNAVNPVAWYRDLTGLSKNDSEGTNFNQKNLDEGNKEPYPNLASVPPPPSRALSASERAALEKSLVADRQNAHYNEEQLEAGAPVPGAVAPPPPAPISQGLASESSSAASSKPASSGPAPAAAAPAPGAASAPTAPASSAQPQAAAKRPATPRRGSEAPPEESSLVSPSVRSVPSGETPTSPPPAPQVATSSQNATTAAIAAPPPPAPPPPTPEVAATAPPPVPTAGTRKGPPPVSEPVADIAFAPGSTNLANGDKGQLTDVAGLYKEGGGKLRVVGYAERAGGKDAAQQELKSFGMALDRAKAVAVALTQLGVPAKDISVEAAPVDAAGSGQPHAEVFVQR